MEYLAMAYIGVNHVWHWLLRTWTINVDAGVTVEITQYIDGPLSLSVSMPLLLSV